MPKLSRSKSHGIHYTPPDLAAFLAEVTVGALPATLRRLEVLDPACGNGALLNAFAFAAPAPLRRRLVLAGYERDPDAVLAAQRTLHSVGVAAVEIEQADFLQLEGVAAAAKHEQLSLFGNPETTPPPSRQFDVIIANPPYVRTQVLGAQKAQALARTFRLTGRVDLYHAFVRAMSRLLKPGGALGLLTSNRFLFIESGAALRRLLRSDFELMAIYDLGDTKLFSAAVLPVVVVARRTASSSDDACKFTRVYEHRSKEANGTRPPSAPAVLDALRSGMTGLVRTPQGVFSVERGILDVGNGDAGSWTLSTPQTRDWLATVRSHSACTFDDVANTHVGIKTTADAVFIRDDWDGLPQEFRPEPALLYPLITHDDDFRWASDARRLGRVRVLYPHRMIDGRKAPVDLERYPRARAYLESHRRRLVARHYVIESGRQWFEIWVPHRPSDWSQPKIVFPDISEFPRFFLDRSGAIVNGDCYWITLRPGQDDRWLLVILAVANSSFSTAYYDTAFHNKLYAGRRRFMAQYVKRFPLPDLNSTAAIELVRLTSRLVVGGLGAHELAHMTGQVDRCVGEAFGIHGAQNVPAPTH